MRGSWEKVRLSWCLPLIFNLLLILFCLQLPLSLYFVASDSCRIMIDGEEHLNLKSAWSLRSCTQSTCFGGLCYVGVCRSVQ